MTALRHLAQLNIGRLRYPTDDPRVADFMNNLDLVNSLAERSQRIRLASQGRQRQRDQYPAVRRSEHDRQHVGLGKR